MVHKTIKSNLQLLQFKSQTQPEKNALKSIKSSKYCDSKKKELKKIQQRDIISITLWASEEVYIRSVCTQKELKDCKRIESLEEFVVYQIK